MIKRCKYRKFHHNEKVYCNYSDYCNDYFTHECKIYGLNQSFDLCMNEAIEELNKKQKELEEKYRKLQRKHNKASKIISELKREVNTELKREVSICDKCVYYKNNICSLKDDPEVRVTRCIDFIEQ